MNIKIEALFSCIIILESIKSHSSWIGSSKVTGPNSPSLKEMITLSSAAS